MSQPLDEVATTPGIDHTAGTRLVRKRICVSRAIRAEKSVGRARASSKEFVCKDWVCPCTAAMASIHVRDYVVEHVLGSQGPARCLTMSAQHQGAGITWLELLHELGPEQARGSKLGHLREVVHADAEEKGQAGSETHRSRVRR